MDLTRIRGRARARGDRAQNIAWQGGPPVYDAAALGGYAHVKRAMLDGAIRACLDMAEANTLRSGMDSGTAMFARTLTEQTLRTLFRHEYRATKWISDGLIDIDTSLDPGTEEFGYDEIEYIGEAKIISPDANDIPLATVKGQRTVHTAVTAAVGFQWSRQELRKAKMQGSFNLVQEKGASAREAWNQLMDRLLLLGANPGEGDLNGLIRHPGIFVAIAANGPWTPGTAPEDVIADFAGAVTAMLTGTAGIETPDTCVMPLSVMRLLETMPFSVGGGDSTPVMELLQRYHPFIKRWEWDVRMDTAGFDGGAAIAIYRNDSMRVRGIMPMGMTPVPEQEEGLVIKVGIESRFGGTIHPRPRSVLLLQGVA